MKWNIKLYKVLNEQYFYFLYFVILYIAQCVIQIIALAVVRFQCNQSQVTASLIAVLITIVFIILFGVALFICEIILNFERIKKCEFGKIWRSDPFLFRIEIYLFAILLAAPLYIIYTLIVLVGVLDNVIENILASIVFLILYIYLIAIPIVMTIIKLLTSRNKVKEKKGELESLLKTDDGFDLISKACEMEYSIENLSCWKDIQDYYKDKTLDDKKKRFEKIQKLYLNGSSSEMEINISGETLSKIQENAKEEKFDNELLKELEFHVERNLKDTFLRLSGREEYKMFLKHRELMVQTNIAE